MELHNSRWATSYYSQGRFIKKYHFPDEERIQREVQIKSLENDIVIELSYDPNEKSWFSYEPYVDLLDLEESFHDSNMLNKVVLRTRLWQHNQISYKDQIRDRWRDSMVPEMKYLLTTFIENANEFCDYLSCTESACFIHGDFILQNIKMNEKRELFICDFENASYGPLGWDDATFVFSLLEYEFYQEAKWYIQHSSCSMYMLLVISAVRYARSIRKNNKSKVRRKEVYMLLRNKVEKGEEL